MKAPSRKRRFGTWVFLGAVGVAYLLTAWVEPGLARQALGTFVSMVGEVAPVFVLVLVLLFLGERFLGGERTKAWLGAGSGLKGWVLAVATGVFSTGPVYAWYALLVELRGRGMRPALMTAVLYARAIKVPLLPLMVHYFGFAFTVVLSLFIVTFSVVNGVVMERLLSRSKAS